MTPETRILGWYLCNALNSACRDPLIEVIDRFVPSLQGDAIKPDTQARRPGQKEALPTAAILPLEALAECLEAYALKPALGLTVPDANVRHAAEVLALDPLEQDLLLLAVRGTDFGGTLRSFIDAAWRQVDDLPRLAAALLGCEPQDVHRRLSKTARLVACGLIEINLTTRANFSSAVCLHPRLHRHMGLPFPDSEAWVQSFLGARVKTPLRWRDFAHVQDDAAMAAHLLRRAVRTAEAGVHVMLVGPAGTGKTELAKALAARAGLHLYAAGEVGEADEFDGDGDGEPSRAVRFGALRLTCNLLGNARNAAVLLDEAEDVLDAPRSFGTRRDAFSKVFLHRTLETLPVPVIWTCNDVSLMDPATLRRMTMVIEVPVPDIAVRTRIWQRILDRERLHLDPDLPARLAQTWEASAGVAASAARAARLTDRDEPALQRALRGVMGAMGHEEIPVPSETDFDLDLVNCTEDLAGLCERLAQPGVSRAWSLCLSGPPGTGKSAFARHLARHLGLPVLQKRASDLLSMFVGGSEKAIARAFREARDGGALLLIDEAEALLFDRRAGQRSWELSQVNEMLTWMETHPLPFVCTTNLPERLDHAVPRRFTLKLQFRALNNEGAALAFRCLLQAEPPGRLPEGLTPGDFAVVRSKAALFGERDPQKLLTWLQEEAEAKPGKSSDIGFHGARRSEPAPLTAATP